MELKTAKGRLFALLAVIISLPFLQYCFHFINSGKLNGAVTNAPDVTFSPGKWWDGSYQRQKDNFLNDSMGFRPDFVRLNNQLDYWLFKKLHANGVVAGKDGYLFEELYLAEYNGSTRNENYIFSRELAHLKLVQDTLERLGKTIVFVEAASKAHYYPDKFPSDYERHYGNTNYAAQIRVADSIGLHHINANGWFLSMKDTASKNRLFSRLGTHWSVYGSVLVADSLIRYMSRVRHINLPSLQITQLKYSDTPRNSDADLAIGLNLIYPLKSEQLCYPEYIYQHDSSRTMPKMIFIGDSFVWTLMNLQLLQNISRDWEFWYYFNEVWTEKVATGKEELHHISNYNWQRSLAQADCIVLMYSTINLKTFHYNNSVIEMMYHHYYPNGK